MRTGRIFLGMLTLALCVSCLLVSGVTSVSAAVSKPVAETYATSATAGVTASLASTYQSILETQVSTNPTPIKDWRGIHTNYAKLVDFNHDGVDELFWFGITDSNYNDTRARVWGTRSDGSVALLGEFNFPQGHSWSQMAGSFYTENNRTYFVLRLDNIDASFNIQGVYLYSLLEDGSWGVADGFIQESNFAQNDMIYVSYPTLQSISEQYFLSCQNKYANPNNYYFSAHIYEYPAFRNDNHKNDLADTLQTLRQVASQETATRQHTQATVNGVSKTFDSYLVNDNNYFKLRDLAQVLNGTQSQFSVTWDQQNQKIAIQTGSLYQPVGGELALPSTTGPAFVAKASAEIWINGNAIYPTAYLVNGNHYYKLRDLAAALSFDVDWNNNTKQVEITTKAGGGTNTTALVADLQMSDSPVETAPGAAMDAEKKNMRTLQAQHPGLILGSVYTDDFDRDGEYETFASSDTDGKGLEGYVWFIGKDKVFIVTKLYGIPGADVNFRIIESKSQSFKHLLFYDSVGANSARQSIYSIHGSTVQAMLPEEGEVYFKVEDGMLLQQVCMLRFDDYYGKIKDWHEIYYQWNPATQSYTQVDEWYSVWDLTKDGPVRYKELPNPSAYE